MVITLATSFVTIHPVLTNVCVRLDTSLDLVIYQENVSVSIGKKYFCDDIVSWRTRNIWLRLAIYQFLLSRDS